MFTASRKPVVLILIILLAANFRSYAQQAFAPTGFSHNDYWRKRPVFDALSNGFTHIEADIYLRGRRLIVSHLPPFFRRRHTLERLYLQPIFNYIQQRGDSLQTAMDTLILMVDIKDRSRKTLRALKKLIGPYRSIISSSCKGVVTKRNLTIILTGKRPSLMTDETDQVFFIDDDLRRINKNHLYPVASCRYSLVLKWRGQGAMPEKEKMRLWKLVANAHRYGKKVRLWAAPEKQCVWQELVNCGVDLINTDQLPAVRDFLESNIQMNALAAEKPTD